MTRSPVLASGTDEVRISERPARNRVAATVDRDRKRIGHVVMRGVKFEAFRVAGSAADMRRYARGFTTIAAAVAFVQAASTDGEA